ncbi:hypothetical protein [Arthrobacter sp. H20]|uniref:hypothetical protein n=1 Tax=Arthrobacter sp. H20 TaxID=1267981 RepID=UPI0004AE509B|nr:hypothetical protein [Arthrobacter sp. H20]
MGSAPHDVTVQLPHHPLDQAAALWRPMLFRASLSAVFGALTIFWVQPSVHVMSVAGGLYLLGLAVSAVWMERAIGLRTSADRWLVGIAPGFLLAGAVLNLWIHTDAMFAQVAALVLVISGAVDLYVGIRQRRLNVVGKDLIAVGAVGVATGLLLPIFEGPGAHALLGVAGGGAIIAAVVLAIASFGYRHDVRHAAAANPDNRVN